MRIAIFILVLLVNAAIAAEGEVDGKGIICGESEASDLSAFPHWPVFGYRFVGGKVFLDRLTYENESAKTWTVDSGPYKTNYAIIWWGVSGNNVLNRQTLALTVDYSRELRNSPKEVVQCRAVSTLDAYDLWLKKQLLRYNHELRRRLKKNKI